MRKEGTPIPTQQGIPLAKDVWMLGIGLGLVIDDLTDRDCPRMAAAGEPPGDARTGGPAVATRRIRAVTQRQRDWSGTLASSWGDPRRGAART